MKLHFTTAEQHAADELAVYIARAVAPDVPVEAILRHEDVRTPHVQLTHDATGTTIEISEEAFVAVVDLYRTVFTAGLVAYQAAKPLLMEAKAKHGRLNHMLAS